jgi:hypothetical protein
MLQNIALGGIVVALPILCAMRCYQDITSIFIAGSLTYLYTVHNIFER